ncbi:MAG TPA: bifunctional hydroxymethylpyrimidine kinase/phosphomethylpyrimidine kinase [Verrucomicrobiota bacterium]|nr:bifunctional hydroxymethylpyrimidine kinase/phosphomethylpyrimidine kinase [Verrucomicrobiota bacterium]
MQKRKLPVAVTIAGSDSGGGAGIQADLKTFTALGVHGATVITCITAQNPKTVLAVQEILPEIVIKQMQSVFEELNPAAAKTGMLFSEQIINAVADYLKNKPCPLIIDPVMVSTSGATLLKPEAISALVNKLFPLADLITPNLDEASMLLNKKIDTEEEFKQSAYDLYKKYKCPVLLKGGHLKRRSAVIDLFYDGKKELTFSSSRIKNVHTHGTGCTLSSAICAYLALGLRLDKAIEKAKIYSHTAIKYSYRIGKYTSLNNSWVNEPVAQINLTINK